MRGWGTDVVALTCILAGAAVSGVVTVAALDRNGGDEVVRHSGVVVVGVDRRVRIQMEGARAEIERAHAEIERAREEVARIRVEVDARKMGDLERRLAEDLRRMGEELARLEGDVGR